MTWSDCVARTNASDLEINANRRRSITRSEAS